MHWVHKLLEYRGRMGKGILLFVKCEILVIFFPGELVAIWTREDFHVRLPWCNVIERYYQNSASKWPLHFKMDSVITVNMSPGACFCYYTLCPLWLQLSYDFYDTPSIEKRLFSLASLTCPFRKYLNLQAMAIAFPLRHLLSFFIFPKDILAYLNGSIQCPLPIISAPFPPSNVFS